MALFLIAMLYLVLPLSVGIFCRLKTPQDQTQTRPKDLILAIWLFTAICAIALVTIITLTGQEFPSTIKTAIILALTAPTIHHFYIQAHSTEHLKKYSTIINWALAYLTLWVTWWATVLAESEISLKVGVSATELPSGIAAIALILAPVIWLLILSFVLFIAYAYSIATLKIYNIKDNHPEHMSKEAANFIGLIKVIATALTVTGIFYTGKSIPSNEKFQATINEAFHYAAFYLKTPPCNISTKKGDGFNILSSGEILIARPKENKEKTILGEYEYIKAKCSSEEVDL